MKSYLAITQLGGKKDRTYRASLQFTDLPSKLYTIKGEGKDFLIFEGTKQIHTLKTLTACKEYIQGVTA